MPVRAGSLKPQQVRVVARTRWQQRVQMNGRTRQNPAYRPSANYPVEVLRLGGVFHRIFAFFPQVALVQLFEACFAAGTLCR